MNESDTVLFTVITCSVARFNVANVIFMVAFPPIAPFVSTLLVDPR